jgi:hypothetical protein
VKIDDDLKEVEGLKKNVQECFEKLVFFQEERKVLIFKWFEN